MMSKNTVILPHLSYTITGILFAIHNELGYYCKEVQYCDRIDSYFIEKNINYKREKFVPPSFKGEKNRRNKVDFLVEDKLLLEIKAKRVTSREDYYQVRRYLQALGIKLGLLVNFRDRYLKPKRILNSKVRIE